MYPTIQAALDMTIFKTPPYSTLAILLLTLTLNIILGLVRRRSMDLESYKRMMVESHRVRKEMMDATRSGNQRRINKAQKRQQDLMAEQSKQSMNQMRSTMLFTLPLILLWGPLRTFFEGGVVAYFPFDAPYIPATLEFGQWYIFCSITLNLVVSRILGTMFEIDPDE